MSEFEKLAYKKDNQGRIPLHYAALFNHTETFLYLASIMSDIDIRDIDGKIPADLAPENSVIKKRELDKKLLKASFGDFTAVKSLISQGANPNSTDSSGRNSLHYAAVEGKLDIVKFLVESNVDAHRKDDKQRTPLDYVFFNIDRKLKFLNSKFLQLTYDYKGMLDVGQYLIDKFPDNEAGDRLNAVRDELDRKGLLRLHNQ